MAKAKTVKEEVTVGTKDLVLADKLEPAILFGDDHETLETLLQKIKTEVSTIVPDISTAKGRKAITANVSRITKSKTTLDKAGKDHVAVQKELLKTISVLLSEIPDGYEKYKKELITISKKISIRPEKVDHYETWINDVYGNKVLSSSRRCDKINDLAEATNGELTLKNVTI